MRIAVDIGFIPSQQNSYKNFIQVILHRLVTEYPQDHFIFFTKGKGPDFLYSNENVTEAVIASAASTFLSERWLYDVTIPFACKKHNADLFIGVNGTISLTAQVPQILVVQEPRFPRRHAISKRRTLFFKKKLAARYVTKAKVITLLSLFSKDEIKEIYPMSKTKSVVIGAFVSSHFSGQNRNKKEETKDKYAESCEYFIYPANCAAIDNLLTVLKAFSIFKKWQRTNLKLLIVKSLKANEKDLAEKLKTYKYKNEVILLSDLAANDWPRVLSGAYAMIFSTSTEQFPFHLVEAMQSEVPIITVATTGLKEIAGDAALFAVNETPEEIAQQMKLIFKDEQLRNQLIEKGKRQAKQFSQDKTAALLWTAIEQAVSK